jgi:hypothetical protein
MTLFGEVTGFLGQYVVVKVTNPPEPHLAVHHLAPREFRGTRHIGQRVKLEYVLTRVSGLWVAENHGEFRGIRQFDPTEQDPT